MAEKLTFEQFKAKLMNEMESVDEAAYGEFEDIEGIGEVEEVESTGGEGRGENWSAVYHLKDHDLYVRFNGFYMSHHGTDFEEGWDCMEEVRPTQKTVTVYE